MTSSARWAIRLLRTGRCSTGRLRLHRAHSAWITSEDVVNDNERKLDVERLFTQDDVQNLLGSLTGIDLENKLFAARKISRSKRPHYAMMTDEALKNTVERMRSIGGKFLQFVPVLEPRTNTPVVLENNREIEAFDDFKYVFCDLSVALGGQVRSVVVREVDGMLRSGTPEEKDRMCRVYEGNAFRPVNEPALFRDPYLKGALERNDHEYVLDWACYYYKPNNSTYIELCQTIFDRILDDQKFDILHSTRHYGPFVFYVVLNKKFIPLLKHYVIEERIESAANLIRLIKIVFPDEAWSYRMKSSTDYELVQEFIRQNSECDFTLHNGNQKSNRNITGKLDDETKSNEVSDKMESAVMDKQCFQSEDGPLGPAAKDYGVRVIRGPLDTAEIMRKNTRKDGKPKSKNE